MEKEIILFERDELDFKSKFYILIDILITNQSESKFESFLLIGIFHLQIISSFFSEQIGIFDPENSKSDKVLNIFEKILRIKALFINNYNNMKIFEIILFFIFILLIIHFILSCLNTSKNSFYSYNNIFINYYIKIFIYIFYNIILDICFANFCFGKDDLNPNFNSVKCEVKGNLLIIIISLIFIVLTGLIYIYITIYYNDSFYLSNSYYAKMSCNYDIFWGLNCLGIACLCTQAKFLTREVYIIYNSFISFLLFIYYLKHFLYYDKIVNTIVGSFHILYFWTSIFSLIFSYINFQEKGIVYIITSIIVCFFYKNIKNRIESSIFLDKPFFKINNQYYLLYYFHNLIEKINNVEVNTKDKSFLSGIIQMHEIECPLSNCPLKTKEDLYLPSTNKWFDKTKNYMDEVFLKNFVIIVMNYFLKMHKFSVDLFLNLSLYYLKVIGNYCQAIYFYKKATELKFSMKEYFSFVRLSIQISKILVEKLKPPNETCTELESLNVSVYYKYDSLSHSFIDEINKDINLSLEFWKIFRDSQKEINKKIDFNKIFKLTDKIRITKVNIENMWNELLKIYSGVNDYFQLYMDYIEQINDDDLKKRDLEALKRKNENFGDNINNNYYYILFNKDTGIIIASGDKGNEGAIQLANNQIENIFKYRIIELKGMNISCIMPKIFGINHSKYMERYFKIGQKRIVDRPRLKLFAKDKNNSIIKITLCVKLFPVLNENVYFASLIKKENIDDIILLDDNFIIQGMSSKLMRILNITNLSLFEDNEIPFYAICVKFLNFYNIFLKSKKVKDINSSDKNNINLEGEKNNLNEENKNEINKNIIKEDFLESIEINENVELEYEIKLPKFLIDYSEKTNKNIDIKEKENSEKDDNSDSIDESDEKDLLLKQEKNINNINGSQTPGEGTLFGDNALKKDSYDFTNINEINKSIEFNKQSDEEKIYNEKMNQYKMLFNKGKLSDLENLIENCNKESLSIEYKFNFTFLKFFYGDNQICYIVRCIDNKNDYENSEEESGNEFDLNGIYKKEKIESIKYLYEIYEDEKNEIIETQKLFLQLSVEDKKFQKLLMTCKNDIINMSKIHGQKNDIIIEDENSSQTHQSGFDTKLIKKNRIEEIRSNLLMNISNFFTLKYIKIVFSLFALFTAIFSIFYIYFFSSLYNNLKNTSIINTKLFQSTLWTTQIISIFVSLRTLYQKNIINYNNNSDFYFYDYFTDLNQINSSHNNDIYYNECISMIYDLYNKSYDSFEYLEMNIPNYLNVNNQLINLYWNRIDISYVNESYINYSKYKDNETFPMAIDQFLSNSIYFIENEIFNSINTSNKNKFLEKKDIYQIYFDYMTYIIIENGYNNILPNQIHKILTIPNILSKYNLKKNTPIIILVCVYIFILIILYSIYYFLIILTNNSMAYGILKVTKIQLEKIEETIKKIKLFSINLKRFKEKDLKDFNEKNKNNSKILENENNQILKRFQTTFSENDAGKKNEQKSQSINNLGFNMDVKKYIPLNILTYSNFTPIIIVLIIFTFLIPVFIITLNLVKKINQLFIVENYIFGKLIITSINKIEIKCFISDCGINKNEKYKEIINMNLIKDILKGITIFPEISDFFDKKFLLNACRAAIIETEEPEKYNNCLNDTIIKNANNTENLMTIINELIHGIQKEYEMEIYVYNKNNNLNLYNRKGLFSSIYFRNMEYIFYNYIFKVGDNFEDAIYKDLRGYLKSKNLIVSLIILIIAIVTNAYCLFFGILLTKKLIHYLSISRCIMKIIPTSVIISTQELEDWIESKY